MKKTIAMFFPLALTCLTVEATAQTGKIKPDYAACLTQQLLDELNTASARRDLRHIEYLLENGCAVVGGREYSLIDRGWSSSTIRVYAGNQSMVLYISTDGIR